MLRLVVHPATGHFWPLARILRGSFRRSPSRSHSAGIFSARNPAGELLTLGLSEMTYDRREELSRKSSRNFTAGAPNLFDENDVLGCETLSLESKSVRFSKRSRRGARRPRLASFSDPFFVTAAIAGGCFDVTDQPKPYCGKPGQPCQCGRRSAGGCRRSSDLPHVAPYTGMRRTRRFIDITPTFSSSKRRPIESQRHLPERLSV